MKDQQKAGDIGQTHGSFEGYPSEGVEAYRDAHPVIANENSNNEPCKIDFSSQIKFNACIRDMSPGNKAPKSS